MIGFYILALLAISATSHPLKENDYLMGLAWEAAATDINVGNNGRFWVPIEVITSTKSGETTQLEAIFQESWCSVEEGNDLDDVCESMCPVYQGGVKATYAITANESDDGNTYVSKRIE